MSFLLCIPSPSSSRLLLQRVRPASRVALSADVTGALTAVLVRRGLLLTMRSAAQYLEEMRRDLRVPPAVLGHGDSFHVSVFVGLAGMKICACFGRLFSFSFLN